MPVKLCFAVVRFDAVESRFDTVISAANVAKLLTKDAARGLAAYFAKLPDLLGK
jgi:hypothetical protein